MDRRPFDEARKKFVRTFGIENPACLTPRQRQKVKAEIFDIMIASMNRVQQAHDDEADKRTSAQIIENAMTCIWAVNDAVESERVLNDRVLFPGDCPGPLRFLLHELYEVYEGRPSSLIGHEYRSLQSDKRKKSEKNGKNETPVFQKNNKRLVHIRLMAAATLAVLMENGMARKKKAEPAVANTLFDCGVGTPQKRGGAYTPSSIGEWRKDLPNQYPEYYNTHLKAFRRVAEKVKHKDKVSEELLDFLKICVKEMVFTP